MNDQDTILQESVLPGLTIEELYEEFDDLPDWDDRCDCLIDLGFALPPLPAEAKNEANRVHGCQSSVWLVAEVKDAAPPVVEFLAHSEAIIVNGLIAVLTALYSGKTPEEILSIDAQEVFRKLGLERHLSPQRRNGLYSMVERVRQLALQAEADA
ncbi:MAG: SufE family protein [Planctomycetota bacterium]